MSGSISLGKESCQAVLHCGSWVEFAPAFESRMLFEKFRNGPVSGLGILLFTNSPAMRNGKYQCHWVRTATLVDPRVTPPASLNRIKIRLVAGLKATLPVPCKKIPNVGVALALGQLKLNPTSVDAIVALGVSEIRC